jgi:hypothetical protein
MMEWESEEQLCRAFMEYARANGWTCYPEQGSWDILLVRGRVQIGIQAKKVADDYMMLQALPDRPGRPDGPQYRAVLYGRASGRTDRARRERENEIAALSMHLRLLVLRPPVVGEGWLPPMFNLSRSAWGQVGVGRGGWSRGRIIWRHYHWRPAKLEWTPGFVPTHAAGVPSPRSVSPWKIAAIRMEQLAAEFGFVCLTDAREIAREVEGHWNASTMLNRFFVCTHECVGGGRQQKWKLSGRSNSTPSACYPEVAGALETETS